MSIFNETESNIRESVESMLCQSFSDFEIIVINDNPNRSDVSRILNSYNDTRIRLYHNTTNIGLAMCMNKAAQIARSKIYARMDADDIAEPCRLEKQYQVIQSGQYDFVFSDYSYIDERSNLIEGLATHQYYSPTKLNEIIAIVNIIHHPTVMFTKSIFEKAGMYRNFPCSQDADLWFRMQEIGCRFYMINKSLLRYRINPNSVSNKRWFQQQLTCNYIYDLSIERLKNKGKDSYSTDNYNDYLKHNGLGNKHKENELKRAYEILSIANNYKSRGNLIYSSLLRIWVFMTSEYMRKHIIRVKKKEILLKNRL